MFYISEYADGQVLPIAVEQATESDYWFLGKTSHRRGHPLPGDAVNYALVWTAGAVSAPGVFKIADTPDESLSNPVVRNINSAMDMDFSRPITLAQVVRQIVRHYPEKFSQVPIGSDGIVRIRLSDLNDEFNQDDDPVTRVTAPYVGTSPTGTRRDTP